MTSHRKAGAPRLIQWTGERCVPWAPDVPVIYEHFHRYLWAAQLVRGRRVLDLGSGEGFGSAILADLATEVVGVDVDAAAVEHGRLNYARPGLAFQTGSATDLSMVDAGAFDAVVAFEVIEHLAEHEQVMSEIRRVLREDGILLISTPDRHVYTEASGYHNPFHVRELSLDEFVSLIRDQFEHCELLGQSVITGSQINQLGADSLLADEARATNFSLVHDGDRWRVADTSSPRYLIALASNVPVSAPPPLSTLADADLGLVRNKEDQIAALHEHLSAEISKLYERLVASESELNDVRRTLEAVEASVTVQLLRSLSARFYRLVPKESRPGRMMQAMLRLIGRVFLPRTR